MSQFILNHHHLERPRSPWEVHAEPLGLHGAQVGYLWYKQIHNWQSTYCTDPTTSFLTILGTSGISKYTTGKVLTVQILPHHFSPLFGL